MSELNQDSTELIRFFGAMSNPHAPFQNTQTGLGTSRDKSTYFEIKPPRLITQRERIWLFRSSKLIQRAVTAYPDAATSKWLKFEFGSSKRLKPDSIDQYLQNLSTGSLQSALTLAATEANLHGDAYILLGIDDGRNWHEPVDELNIKSFKWVEVLYPNEVQIKSGVGFRKPELYQLNLSYPIEADTEIRYITVHKSRILHLYGVQLTGQSFIENGYKNDSIIQAALNEFSRMQQGLGASSAMLADYSLFKYKLHGLRKIGQKTNLGDRGTLDIEMLMQRFIAMQMGMSVTNGLAVDAETEDAEFINRSFQGVDSILNILIDAFVSATDLPRSKLLGTSSRVGLGTEGRGEQERYEWASLVEDWQNARLRDHIRYCLRLALLSKDSPSKGRLPDTYGLRFNSVLQLTQKETAEIRKIESETDNLDITNGIITPLEARMSRHGGNSAITLDPNTTAQMSELKEPVEKPELNKDDATPTKRIINWQGFEIGLQYLPFEKRHGKTLSAAYGHFRNTKGSDNMAVDVYVGTNLESNKLFVIDQHIDGVFDEHKFVIGVDTIEQAKSIYLAAMPESFLGKIEEANISVLKNMSKTQKNKDADELTDTDWNALSEISAADWIETLTEIIE